MIDLILPVIEAFWNEEKRPDQWGSSIITNIWKGKGDREVMGNQRGIAYSGSIETIAEEAVCNILTNRVEFTQAQAGGKKGGSTSDHVFIIRGIIQIALKEKRAILITFLNMI